MNLALVRRWIAEQFRALVLPPMCPACRGPSPRAGELCVACRDGLWHLTDGCELCTGPVPCRDCRRFRGPIARIHASYHYRETAGRLVRAVKLDADGAALGFLGRAMARRFARRDRAYRRAVIVPVPLATRRRRARGFNQACELARFVQRRLRVPLLPRALERTRDTLPQGSPLVTSRAKNLEGAFRLGRSGRRVAGRLVLLVDDVVTSGTTVRECARVLRRDGGATRVEVIAAASARQ